LTKLRFLQAADLDDEKKFKEIVDRLNP
jgi:hypothetical protein